MKKRIYSGLLALAVCLGLLTPGAYAVEDFPDEEMDMLQQTRGTEYVVGHNEDLRAAVKKARDGDTIIVTGYGNVNEISGKEKEPWVIDKAITIRGQKTGEQVPSISTRSGGIILGADVVLEDIELSLAHRVRNVIMVNGHKLTLRNVTVSGSAQAVHLIGGTLTGYDYGLKVPQGPHSQIWLTGNTRLSNIYAGSLSYADWTYKTGMPNDYNGDVTITIDEDAKVDHIYACGAQERPVEEGNFFDGKKTEPPIQDPAQFTTSGTVEIHLTGSTVKTVDGNAGNGNRANLFCDGGEFLRLSNMSLTNLGNFTISAGYIEPTVPSGGLNNTTVHLKNGTRLYFKGIADQTIGSLESHGGTIVVGESEPARITGSVTGTTTVAIGDVSNDGSASNKPANMGQVYVSAPASQDGAFTLLNYQSQKDMRLVRDNSGNWQASNQGAVMGKVQSASIVSSDSQDKWSAPVYLPMQVAYDPVHATPVMERIPVTITVNGDPTTMAGKPQTGYQYLISKHSLKLQFGVIDDESGRAVDALVVMPYNNGSPLVPGPYTIAMVIPGTHTADGQPISLETTLTITDGVTPPIPPVEGDVNLSGAQVTVLDGPFVYNQTAHTPKVEVMVAGKVLVENNDYTLSYADNTQAGQAAVIVEAVAGSGYTGRITKPFTIAQEQLTMQSAMVSQKVYDGTTAAEVTDVTFQNASGVPVALTQNVDYTAHGQFNHANADRADQVAVQVTLQGDAARNYVLTDATITVSQTIQKEQAVPRAGHMEVKNAHAAVYPYQLNQLLPDLESGESYGDVRFTVRQVDLGAYCTQGAVVNGTTLSLPIESVAGSTEQKVGTVTIGIETSNYTLGDAVIEVRTVNKLVPNGAPTLSSSVLTYGQPLSTITLSGAMNDGTVQGTFTWEEPDKVYPAGTHQAAWCFTPADTTQYQTVTGTIAVTVNQIMPTGAPKYTPITADGKTLADAQLTTVGGTFSVEGTVRWNLDETTVVVKNMAYEWTFTPADPDNYQTLTGKLIPYAVGGGGGGGGGSSSGGGNGGSGSGSSQTHPDGSTTTVDKKGDGSVVTTTKRPDGSTSQVTVQKDGSSVATNTTAGGTVGKVTEDAAGRVTEVQGQVSSKDAQRAKENGEAVKLPVEVPVSTSSQMAPEVRVTIPNGGAAVEIPVQHLTPGTVPVLVHSDGTEEIVRKSGLTQDGVTLELAENATLKLVDNSKQFQDVHERAWCRDAVDFMSARNLMQGTTEATFSPDKPLSRAMLATILYNLEGRPAVNHERGFQDVAADSWCADAISWAAEAGVLVGYDNGTVGPDQRITREQLAVMLYRYAGYPAATSQPINGFVDGTATGGFARDAMSWAVENGIIQGKEGGRLDPKGQATRAQSAQMVMRFMTES